MNKDIKQIVNELLANFVRETVGSMEEPLGRRSIRSRYVDIILDLLAQQRQALKEQVLEAVGEDEEYYFLDHTMGITTAHPRGGNQERNKFRAELRQRIEAVFEKEKSK